MLFEKAIPSLLPVVGHEIRINNIVQYCKQTYQFQSIQANDTQNETGFVIIYASASQFSLDVLILAIKFILANKIICIYLIWVICDC